MERPAALGLKMSRTALLYPLTLQRFAAAALQLLLTLQRFSATDLNSIAELVICVMSGLA